MSPGQSPIAIDTSPMLPRVASIDSVSSADLDSPVSPASIVSEWSEGKQPQPGRWRHTVGIILLLATVFLWTASNFLASTIFADNEYSKPYFVTYTNTAFFIIPLFPMLLRHLYDDRFRMSTLRELLQRRVGKYKLLRDHEDEDDNLSKSDGRSQSSRRSRSPSAQMLLEEDMGNSQELSGSVHSQRPGLTLAETAKLSLEFCILWFLANYFAAACLEYTTVASSTILASTSSIWTLFSGSMMGVERFTLRKLFGVLASLAGIALISTVDVSGENDENRGTFPHKSPRELAIGDSMAFFSAVLYGFYAVLMKKRIGDESKVNMPLFFGLVGLFNCILLWPGLIILHVTGVETFELPPTSRILTIVLVNSASSLVSDFCWAYAMLLTSPLVVTVGLSLTIPLSLVGQMILDSQYSSALYWVGAVIMFISFIFINHEDKRDEDGPPLSQSDSSLIVA
ncbi:vacuolar membrane protein [Lophium mytilinum]|uniref:Vacuolar membrane protein n=1 Tax=Lophium mytilinum TaxID=390894 RepID=A0A6A6QD02_9PEZI|nr:vacuolar membrane protein [Lophium mytilinum]